MLKTRGEDRLQASGFQGTFFQHASYDHSYNIAVVYAQCTVSYFASYNIHIFDTELPFIELLEVRYPSLAFLSVPFALRDNG
jgi:hypothetical protein